MPLEEQGHTKEAEATLQFNIKNTREPTDASFEMSNHTKIGEVKEKFLEQKGKAGECTVRLLFKGKELKDDMDLAFYSVQDGDTIQSVY